MGEYRGPEKARAFLGFAAARLNERAEAAAFRTYIADTLFFMGEGKAISVRWNEILHPAQAVEQDPDEVIDRIKTGLKGL